MKANTKKRKIFADAVDMLTEDSISIDNKDVMTIPIDKIKPYHNHPFKLYTGERLEDMVESVREHGVLNPVIINEAGGEYEMLSGHNRMNAAKIVGLKEVPAIVKKGLAEDEAYVYVVETNMIQRSFAELLPSEKAAVMSEHYMRRIQLTTGFWRIQSFRGSRRRFHIWRTGMLFTLLPKISLHPG